MSWRELGTAIYKVSPMGVFAWKSHGLVKDKTVPFLPNSGYAFVVIHPAFSLLRSSWHGREAISVPVEKPRLWLAQHLLPRGRAGADGGDVRRPTPISVAVLHLLYVALINSAKRGGGQDNGHGNFVI